VERTKLPANVAGVAPQHHALQAFAAGVLSKKNQCRTKTTKEMLAPRQGAALESVHGRWVGGCFLVKEMIARAVILLWRIPKPAI
jgi:hypothetical protein